MAGGDGTSPKLTSQFLTPMITVTPPFCSPIGAFFSVTPVSRIVSTRIVGACFVSVRVSGTFGNLLLMMCQAASRGSSGASSSDERLDILRGNSQVKRNIDGWHTAPMEYGDGRYILHSQIGDASVLLRRRLEAV
jgi:hypothetical protein